MRPPLPRRIVVSLLLALGPIMTVKAAEILSFHGGTLTSNGVNAAEIQITPASINAATFGKQFTTDITDVPDLTGIPASTLPSSINYSAPAGQVYAQPLVKTGVNITTGSAPGMHDVVFVATSMNSVFAIDAIGGGVLWKDSFIYRASGNPNPLNAALPAGVTAVPGGFGTETNSQDVSPWIGIVGTPVIDGAAGYLYIVAKTREARGGDQTHPHYVLTLHKIRLADGLDAPAVIADTTLQTSDNTFTFNSGPYVVATGLGAISVQGQSRIYVNAVRHMGRPALVLASGRLYVAFASHGDNQPYHGWLLTYDASTMACNGAWNATPNGSEAEAGIWQGGGGVVIDAAGYIYFETGNGAFDGQNNNGAISGLDAKGFPVNGNYGDCFMKLALDPSSTQGSQSTNKNGWGLKVVDYFSPYNNAALDAADRDLGSGGPIVLPDSAGSSAHPHLLIGGGKEGKLYLMDRDNMGKFTPTDAVVQTFGGAVNAVLSVPAYFNGRLYASAGYGGNVASWPLLNATISTGSGQATPDSIAFPGCSPYITANGTTNGVMWVIDKGTGQLRAYDAMNLASELWTSSQNANRDALGSAVKFACPAPVNGRVFIGTADHLVCYGPPVPATAPPAAPAGCSAGATGPSTTTLTWSDQSANESEFRIERSSNGVDFVEIGAVGVNQTSYRDSGLSSQATYFYRVRAYNLYQSGTYSSYTNVASATTPSLESQAPVNFYHFDEGTGSSTVDSSGGDNGTLLGSPLPGWISSGRVGNANLSFSGNGIYNQNGQSAVQVASDLSPTLGKTSSLLFWLKTTQTGNDTHWMAPAVTGCEMAASANDIGWGCLDASGRIGLAVGDSGSIRSASPVNDGKWHHIGLSRDSASGRVRVYVDGVLSASGGLETGDRTSPFRLLGARADLGSDGASFTGANFFYGQLDDIRVYNLEIDATVVASIALPPTTPTNLTVTPASGTELDLAWSDNATSETGYEIWRSTNGSAWLRVAQLPVDSTSYLDGGITQGTPYAYYVRAVNSAGNADSVIVNSATPTPPITPTGAVVTFVSSTEVDLQWSDNASDETGYKILRRSSNANFAQVGSLPPNSTSYQDKTVQPGITYDYHIQAYNIAGYSDFTGLTVTTWKTDLKAWLASYFNSQQLGDSTITGLTADPDQDGVPNLAEYAFGQSPTTTDRTALPVIAIINGHLTITFLQRVSPGDLLYIVEVSSDLQNWQSGSAYTTQVSSTAISGLFNQVVVQDNAVVTGSLRRFIRVRITY